MILLLIDYFLVANDFSKNVFFNNNFSNPSVSL